MALIECSECGAEVSNKAKTCVKCGAPLMVTVSPGPVVTTQQTAKKYKGIQLLGAAMICGGVVACTGKEAEYSAGLFLVGLVVYLTARIAAWWNHG